MGKKALKLFNLQKEVYLIIVCRFLIFLSSLYFVYNFIDILFYLLSDNINTTTNFLFLIKTILVLLLYYLAFFFDNKLSHKISSLLRNQLRQMLYTKIEKLSSNYTKAIPTSNFILLNSTAITNIELYFSKFIPQIYATVFIVSSSILIFTSIHLYLGLALLCLYPLIPLSIMLIIKKAKHKNKATFKDFMSLSQLFFDRLNGFDTAKLFAKEDNLSKEIDTASENYRKTTMKLLVHQLNSINVMDAITYLSMLIMGLIAIFHLNQPLLIIFVIVGVFEAFRPLRELGGLFHISMRANIELEHINKLLAYPEDKKDEQIQLEAGDDITINDLSFSYDDKKVILNNISMTFKQSTTNAILGLSGSGKSTIIKLIMGLISPNIKGQVLYGKHNLSITPYEEIAKITTLIASDSYLTKGSIRSHLQVNDEITEQDMLNALSLVNLKDLVLANGGLDYEINPAASNLSGGEKQRLLTAKAILKNSYIYILDEAVSNIDEYSKNIILKAFDLLKKDKIIILISHDLDSTKNCDNIYVLDKGEVLEKGTYQDLITNNSLYKNLCEQQDNLKNKFLGREWE